MENQKYSELKETMKWYGSLQQDYDKHLSVGKVVKSSENDDDHATQELTINMVSKKNMNWSNVRSGKGTVQAMKAEEAPDDEEKPQKSAKKDKAAKNSKEPEPGVCINGAAFCQVGERQHYLVTVDDASTLRLWDASKQ